MNFAPPSVHSLVFFQCLLWGTMLNVRWPHWHRDVFDFRTCESVVVGSKEFGLFQVKLQATFGNSQNPWRCDGKVCCYSWPCAQSVTVHIAVEP